MQPAQPDRPVSTIYNNIIGEGRAAPAAPDPSLDHFWRVLFAHFPKTVVKFIKKSTYQNGFQNDANGKQSSILEAGGDNIVPGAQPPTGLPKNGFLKGCQGAPARCSTRVLIARDAATRPPRSTPANEGPQLTCIRAV